MKNQLRIFILFNILLLTTVACSGNSDNSDEDSITGGVSYAYMAVHLDPDSVSVLPNGTLNHNRPASTEQFVSKITLRRFS